VVLLIGQRQEKRLLLSLSTIPLKNPNLIGESSGGEIKVRKYSGEQNPHVHNENAHGMA
jgi:hypothetical protein